MGVSDVLARSAARHAHVLPVEAPGHWRTRASVERAVLARGWRLAFSPADADVLVVCGDPGPRLNEAVDAVWHQMPGPRVRLEVRGCGDVAGSLDAAYADLLDTARHRDDAHHRPTGPALLAEQRADPGTERHEGDGATELGGHGGMELGGRGGMELGGRGGHEGMDHGGHEGMQHGGRGGHEGMDHGGHEGMQHGGHGGHGGMDHGGHEGMQHGDHGDHGDMDMAPGGIPLAEGGEDRDELEMDVLNVRLGPALPHWPAGLVLRCGLQGDVIATAQAELVDGPGLSDPGTARQAHWARHLDNVASLLALAGWEDAAAETRAVRDAALRYGADERVGDRLARLHRRVRRSRLLRWSLRGLRPLSDDDVRRHRFPVDAIGDTYDRLTTMLQRAATGANGDDAGGSSRTGGDGPRHQVGEHTPTWSTHHLAHLVTGLDLATARLVVASLDVHELRADHAGQEVSHA